MSTNYNFCLDYIKGIACIFVVWMHCEFPGLVGTAVQAISRFCVPLFFMVSGYFCFNVFGGKKKIVHVAKITLYASLFYLAFVFVYHLVFHNQDIRFQILDLVAWLVFNRTIIVAGQYWFLFALLYTYIFFFIVKRYCSNKQLYRFAFFSFVAYYVLAQGVHLVGIHIPNFIYRNWLIEGFAFFMLGHFLHEYQDRIKIANKTLVWLIVVSTLLCWPERWLMGRDFGVNICTLPQVTAMFIYAIKNSNKHKGAVQEMGKYYSMFIYILHPAVWHFMEGSYQLLGISNNTLSLYLLPIVVVMLTILFSAVCDRMLITKR